MGREHLSWLTQEALIPPTSSEGHCSTCSNHCRCHLPAVYATPWHLYSWCQFALCSKKYLLWARTPSNLCSKHQLDNQSTTEDPTCCIQVAVSSVVASVVMILLGVVTMMSHQPLVPAASTGSLAPLFVRTGHVISPANGGPAPGQPTNHSTAAVASCKNVQSCVACSTAAPQHRS